MSHLLSYVLVGVTRLYKHTKSDTLYLAIPSKVAQDSTFIFKKGEDVSIRYDPKKKVIIIEPLKKLGSEKRKQ